MYKRQGKDVPQIFWLFYKLEEEAAKAGGHVSFILGNHEPMVLALSLIHISAFNPSSGWKEVEKRIKRNNNRSRYIKIVSYAAIILLPVPVSYTHLCTPKNPVRL